MMILTAKQGHNADLFPDILDLYVPEGAMVLDATYGEGLFWRDVSPNWCRFVRFDMFTSPVDVRGDFRALPFKPDSFDCIVFDPPYAQHGKGAPIKESIASVYQLTKGDAAPTSAGGALLLYLEFMREAHSLLHQQGMLILKCQDQIESGQQHWIHAALIAAAPPHYITEDLFVLVQRGVPAARHKHQLHARKNHSYFLVLRKR